MKIIDPYVVIERAFSAEDVSFLEKVGRTCYKSENKITEDSGPSFVKMLLDRGHTAMLEHVSATVRIVTDRGVTHELVRHRLAAYAQESTRYCNYSKNKFGNEISVIRPFFFCNVAGSPSYDLWLQAMSSCEVVYLELIEIGASAQEARSVLPNSLKTEIVITANAREWRHIFGLRAAKAAHPQMRQVMVPLLREFAKVIPCLFVDLLQLIPFEPELHEAGVSYAITSRSGDDA